MEKKCSVDGCDRPVNARNWCQKHYYKWRRTGDPMGCQSPPSHWDKCSIDGCDKNAISRGWCSVHYQRWRRTGDPLKTQTDLRGLQKNLPCEASGCDERRFAKGYCEYHYHHLRNTGKVNGGRGRNRRKAGEGTKNNGYHFTTIVIDGKRRQVGTHRVVYSEYLGRPLRKGENVHHINGLRDDNRIENLELWSSSQPSGQRVKDKLAWARDIIATYAGEEDKLCGSQQQFTKTDWGK
jgi:hypothetical protein